MKKEKAISAREREVLHWVANELTTKEIADKLLISGHTAISHRKNLMDKLEVKNTAGLVRRAFELGIL
jgi:DNA-binding CsgD family transcriptional regulator